MEKGKQNTYGKFQSKIAYIIRASQMKTVKVEKTILKRKYTDLIQI